MMNQCRRISRFGLILGSILLTVRAAAQTPASAAGTPASPAARAATAPATPPKPPVDVLPDSVPDDVNPFADGKNLPQPLPPAGAMAPLSVDVEIEDTDGLPAMAMLTKGPDFTLVSEPFDDWLLAPVGADESVAFVYKNQTAARLSLALYKGQDLMPEINRDNLIQYLAAVRAADPKMFALLTPFPKGSTDMLDPTRFCGFTGQGFKYALATPTVLIYHVWVVDLNHQYQLLVKLASPPALLSRLESQVLFTLGRGHTRKGLGVAEPKPAASPATGSGTAPTANSAG
jgi:hypothetical protein